MNDITFKTSVYLGLGLLLRLLVAGLLGDTLQARVEVTTSINSWKRANEAIFLWDLGHDPYLGDIFHEFPLGLVVYKLISLYSNVDIVFSLLDLLIAIILKWSTYSQLRLSGETTIEAEHRSYIVFLTYLFSPMAIVSCSGRATSILTNLLVALIGLTMTSSHSRLTTCLLTALLTCNNIHYATITIPALICLEYCSYERKKSAEKKKDVDTVSSRHSYYGQLLFSASLNRSVVYWFTSVLAISVLSSFVMGGSWTYLESTYLFSLKINDLTPNIGMFWYFFTEVFEQFASFFTWIVQINAFIHVIPLTVTLRDSPLFAFYATYLTSTIFQPYPSLSNMALLFSLTFQWSNLFQHMRRILIVSSACVACMSLWPVFWHLWIIAGTANSNFYFGSTLAFSTSLILYMIDLFNAHGIARSKTRLGELHEAESVIS